MAIYTCDLEMDPGYVMANGGAGWDPGENGTVFFGSNAIVVSDQGWDQVAYEGEPAFFFVDATGQGPLTYQWRKDEAPLPENGHYIGVHTDFLVIDDVHPSDQGEYDVVIDDDCGPAFSEKMWLIVLQWGDMNCDNALDGLDIEPFLLALLDPAEYQATYLYCDIDQADINRDGYVNMADVGPFAARLVGN